MVKRNPAPIPEGTKFSRIASLFTLGLKVVIDNEVETSSEEEAKLTETHQSEMVRPSVKKA
jgi:hypothetical protein